MAQNGYLASRIYTSLLPVEGATITVIKKENGRLKLTDKGTDLGNIVFMEFLDD